ncbi:MAG: ATP-binding protein [Thalassobaculaceae bacterium]|nr:ATP-binding protein [Thalassobaculaceae bacterium]
MAELRRLCLLDTPAEQAFDRVTILAAKLLDVPIALVSLVDEDRQWFKSKFGLEADETPRSVAFCSHTILGDETMVVEDARLDERFQNNPLVVGHPNIRFYAGAPLRAPNGATIGTFCIVDSKPRHLSAKDREVLSELCDIVREAIWLRDLIRQSDAERSAARQASQLLVDMIEAAPDGLAKFGSDGRVEVCNSAYRKYFSGSEDLIAPGATMEMILRAGLKKDIFVGAGTRPEEQETWLKERMRRHAELGEPFEEQTANGRWMRISESRTADGGVVVTRTDVTAQRRHAEALRRLHAVTLDQGSDLTERVNALLRAGCELFGLPIGIQSRIADGTYTVERVVAPDGDIAPGAQFELAATYCANVFDGTGRVGFSHVGASEMRTHPCYVATGLESYIGCPLVVAGRRYGTVNFSSPAPRGAIEDDELDLISHIALLVGAELARYEANEALEVAKLRAEEASRQKSAFLAMMSHEIRTPLNGLLGMVAVLAGTGLDDEQREMVEVANMSGKNLLVIINDILDFSKLDAERLQLDIDQINLVELVSGVRDIIAPQAFTKNVSVNVHIDPALGEVRDGDAVRLRQVLLNLVGNAVKFTDQGSVTVRMEQGGTPETVRFAVEDTGIGIPQESLPTLFQHFSQVDTSISRRYGGTGLGLAICKKLVTLMGGEMTVRSKEGSGSTFGFEIPLPRSGPQHPASEVTDAPRQDGAAASSHGDETRSKAEIRRLTVLVAEDNAVNQLIMREALKQLGHNVDFANDGSEAVEAAMSGSYDLILMDIQMPGTDGVEATRQIVRRLGDRRPPIVALTAHVLHGDEQRFRDAGMDDYISKPIDLEQLEAVLLSAANAPVRTPEPRAEKRPDSDEGRLNFQQANQLRKILPPEGLQRIIRSFGRDLEERIALLKRAQADGDIEEMKRQAHAIAGLAGNVGAASVASHARAFMSTGAEHEAPEVTAWIETLALEADATVNAFEAWLDT